MFFLPQADGLFGHWIPACAGILILSANEAVGAHTLAAPVTPPARRALVISAPVF
ncbi:hypothetical protein [Sphingomonas sp. CV7422]|uniref:hypothetical protein n=1 Tax=Sphingomonas sp. CV7422 TaxID=3018036 RepID=UPI0022FDE60D|nr:hypothetical protein [Sphingomonas sp. CV7422]